MRRIVDVRLIAVTMLLTITVVGQNRPAATSIAVKDVKFEGLTTDVLLKVAEKYRVVVGVSGVRIGSDRHALSISMNRGTLKDLFDEIVRQDPRFEWREDKNGAIHFSLRGSLLPLLDVPVRSFAVKDPARLEISISLNKIPEVHSWLSGRNCSMDEMIAGKPPKNWDKFAVSVTDVPFRMVFDQIAAKSKTYFWSAIQYSDQPCAINIQP